MSNPRKILSKSKFSMYLRTQCDRELYLSLFKDKGECLANGIPVPLKSRPGVQLITKSGREFEREQYDQLISAIPYYVVHESAGSAPIDLVSALETATDPCFILQPRIEPENFRDAALRNMGLTDEEIDYIPQLAGLKPDMLFIHAKDEGEFEILPDGTRRVIRDDDRRIGISVIDLKNVAEGNPSYSGEVCLYAFFLANWLSTEGAIFANRFFVSDRIYLWKHMEMPKLNAMLGKVTGADPRKRISALLADLQNGLVDYLIYMPSVRKFLKEDVPRVVKKGDREGWQALEYHVNPRCGSCDWLGHIDWLTPDDRKIYERNPKHYCIASAEDDDHLCKMPHLSKGATQILSKGGRSKIADLVGVPPTLPLLKKHSFLKRDRSQISHRASALTSGLSTVDFANKVPGLARYTNAEYDIIVNFDAGEGLLTGLSMRGRLAAPFSKEIVLPNGPKGFVSYGEEAFVVPKNTHNAEWATLKAFIEKLSEWITVSQSHFTKANLGSVHTQICFWEQRQYEELCNAFGRHLINVLSLNERSQRALAWLFPSDELMEREEQIAPGIVFIRDIVDSAVRLPVKYSNTLLSVVEHYHVSGMPPRNIDRYYREPLGNAIPRERIFEIWKSTTGTVRMYGQEETITKAIDKYASILKSHAWALASVTAKLREDLRESLQGHAPALNLSILQGARNVAYDSKVWMQWQKVNTATAQTEAKASLIASVERLESSYEAILLTTLLKDLGNNRFEFEVSEDSTEAKLEEGGGYYVLGIPNIPGFPLMTALKLGLTPPNSLEYRSYNTPFYKVIAVSLITFDRVQRRATIEIRARWHGVTQVFDALFSSGLVSISGPIYLLESTPPDFDEDTRRVLESIGRPAYATPARESLAAMGAVTAVQIQGGNDPSTPIAEVLWKANQLAQIEIRSEAEAESIANFAETANLNRLNTSQKQAVLACARNKLSVIWGPPGTGKTDTLVALIHSIVREAQSSPRKKILVTGPNYRAVEEIMWRLIGNLERDTSCQCEVFMVYSRSREPKTISTTGTHLNAFSFGLESSVFESTMLRESIESEGRVTIVGTTVHQIIKITDFLTGKGNPIRELFDFVVIDESSQVEVVRAIQPLAVLKSTGQLVVAGDHLQMPPISQLEPPRNAEYLVGSIQTYLIERFGIRTNQLLINYRSNQDLVDYAKTIGYPQRLEAFRKTKQLTEVTPLLETVSSMPDNLPRTMAYEELLKPGRAVAALIHEDTISSQANEIEAKIVAGLAFCIRHSMASTLDTGDNEELQAFDDDNFFRIGIGFVTPHKAQKALVIKELRALFPGASPDVIYEAVDTVERFQGGQRQTIIISFGVGDIDIIEGEESFLLQKERTNVAVSRAEAKCIMIMPKSLAYHLPADQDAARTARAIKSYIEEFCTNRMLVVIENEGIAHSAEVRWH